MTGVLDGKVAIVTGAGKGVGAGIALAMAGEGAKIVIAARSEEKAAPAIAAITERGGEAIAVVCNVAEADDVTACVATTVEHFGRLDIVVNNANVSPYGNLLEVTDKAFTLGFKVGPLAVLRFMRAAHPHLAAARDDGSKGGVIINLTSGSMLRHNSVGLGAYAATKEAISSLTRSAAVEWGPDGIRVVNVMPFAESDGMAWWREHDPDAYAEVLAEVPLGRIGEAEADIGVTVAWLCSEGARYITGTTLVVDGGQLYHR